MTKLHIPLTLMAALLLAAPRAAGDVTLRAAVHVDTSVSHDTRTIRIAGIKVKTLPGDTPRDVMQIAEIAKKQGLDVVILADRPRADVSYGLTRFSRLFKVTVSEGSIRDEGAQAYLDAIQTAEGRTGVLILPGIECIPYYSWSGNVLKGLRLSHLYEHMVLVGLDSPEAIAGIPDTAGGYGWRFSWTVVFNVVFLGLIAAGILMWRKKKITARVGGAIVILVSVLMLIDSAPFLPRAISPYEQPGVDPGSIVAEYAKEHGALAFWAHPDVRPGPQPKRFANWIDIDVLPYPDALLRTSGYAGFAMFNAGIEPGRAGAEWDQVLSDYLSESRPDVDDSDRTDGEWDHLLGRYVTGSRPAPVYAVSECDFDVDSAPDALAEGQTILWARDRSKKAVLDSLRQGRCYATRTDFYKKLAVEQYQLIEGSATGVNGAPLVTPSDSAMLDLQLRVLSGTPQRAAERLRAKVIVDGEATDVPFTATSSGLRAAAPISFPPAKKYSYVRVLVCDNEEPVLALNPIFVTREPDK